MQLLVNCAHWRESAKTPNGGGVCAIGVYKDPSFGVCRHCAKREKIREQDESIRPAPILPARVGMKQIGPAIWAEIRGKKNPTPEWFATIGKRLWTKCRQNWDAYCKAHPPDFGAGWPYWVDNAHNGVNEERGVRKWTRAESDARWRTFSRVWVISLDRTPQRLVQFSKRFPKDWPFPPPEHFHAIDGAAIATPEGWNWKNTNHGAIGCRASWLAVVKEAIDAGCDKPILVFEDDAQLVAGAADKIKLVMNNLPDQWEILFLGGEHNQRPTPFSPGIVRCNETGRTHALIIHPRYFKALHEFWTGYLSHVDHGLRSIAKSRNFYAVDPFIAIQGENFSTLRNRQEPARSWDPRVKIEEAKPMQTYFVPDRIVCLHLESKPERWEAFTASIATSAILSPLPIVKYRATPPEEFLIPDWWAKERPSHYATGRDELNIIERAYLDGCQSLLLFEDDALLSPDFDATYRRMVTGVPEDWMGIWFTRLDVRKPEPFAPGVLRMKGAHDHSCILLSRRGLHRVYSHVTWDLKKHIDHATAHLHQIEPHFYTPEVAVVHQTACRDGSKRDGARPPWENK